MSTDAGKDEKPRSPVGRRHALVAGGAAGLGALLAAASAGAGAPAAAAADRGPRAAAGAAGAAGPAAAPEPAGGTVPCLADGSVGPYHLGFVVPDIERTMRDLTGAVGTEWNEVRESTLGDWDYRIVFSRHGPLYTELIDGPPGSPWDSSAGARCDHLGFWAGAIDACAQHLVAAGFPLDFDARPHGRPFTYHRMPGDIGLRLELVDVSVQPEFLESWDPDGATMPPLSC